MLSIKEIDHKESELCFELDSNTISLWTKKQWESECKKQGVKVVAIFVEKNIIGLYVVHTILDEAQISYFSIKKNYRRQGYGSYLMNYLIRECEKLNINKLQLEVSEKNAIAEFFYTKFNFLNVGRRKNYYKDGTDAVLKEKIL